MTDFSLRPRTDADAEFLYRLYASTREEELRMLPWTDEQKAAFLHMQFTAQTAHYDEHYDVDGFLIIERDGRPVGRFYVDRDDDDIRVVDIALLPEERRRGIGAKLMSDVIEEARRTSRKVSIHVEHDNPAMRLYERLGFQRCGDTGVYFLMEWSPENPPA